jgi:hypothetical protein
MCRWIRLSSTRCGWTASRSIQAYPRGAWELATYRRSLMTLYILRLAAVMPSLCDRLKALHNEAELQTPEPSM